MNARRQLRNGLTLLCQTRPEATTTVLGLYWLAGSRFELPHETGAAHLLEHLLLAGRGAAMAALGGAIDAATGRELLALSGTVPAADADALLGLLLESLRRPDFSALERERAVIRLERRLLGEDLAGQAAALGWAGHPLGRSVSGDDLGGLDELTLRGYWQRLLVGRRLWLVAVGPQSPDWLVRRVDWLAGLPAGAVPGSDPPPIWRGGWFRRAAAGAPGRVLWTMPVAGAAAGVDHGLLMLQCLLGGGGDSLLYQRLREHHGWVYGIDSWLEQYREAGLWGLDMGCEPGRVEALMDTVTAVVNGVLETPPDAATLDRLRRGLVARLLLDEADPGQAMARLARETVYLGTPLSLARHRAGLAAVDGENLRARLKQFWPAQLRLCLG